MTWPQSHAARDRWPVAHKDETDSTAKCPPDGAADSAADDDPLDMLHVFGGAKKNLDEEDSLVSSHFMYWVLDLSRASSRAWSHPKRGVQLGNCG